VRQVELIQFDVPPLRDGTYTVAVIHTAGQGAPDGFEAKRTFAVSGERFSIDPSEIAGVFPPDLANGEYAGVLPHVLISRRTLPWERESVGGGAPWLAVLLFDESEWARVTAYQSRQVADLVPEGQTIKPIGKQIPPGLGRMPAGTVSYPGLTQLEVGEAPTDTVAILDIPADLFSRVAPSAEDLPYLGHIRKADTADSVDQASNADEVAVVLGNRVPADTSAAHAALVSLEGMGAYLPHADGTQSTSLTAATVRLTSFRTWRFFANTGGETFLQLVESLNPATVGSERLSTLQVPFTGDPPSSAQVAQARAAQAAGSIGGADAQILLHDAFGMGYVPLCHHLRHGGETVSWYRGPLAPLPVGTEVAIPLVGPDQATRYDPHSGMFDVSYSAAWQLGQLLAVRDRSFALAVADWRHGLLAAEAVAQEQVLIEALLGGAFDGIAEQRRARARAATASDEFPQAIVRWLAKLRRLEGIPFNYLVPDERMLPPESVRMFHLDNAWMDALLDGALSIGRSTTGELARHAERARALHVAALDHAATIRPNPSAVTLPDGIPEKLTGLLMRSQVVSGWPRLNVKAWSDTGQQRELKPLRIERISNDVLLCLWHGVLADFAIREAPEQLHCGVEQTSGGFSATLRDVTGAKPGIQFTTDPKGGPPEAVVPSRSDRQTIQVAIAAASILDKLNNDFAQGISPAAFTSAELALELVKGVADVEFRLGG
jgi:hypothetical protein